MNITLNEFIEQKQKELEEQYRKVDLYDIPSVTLRGRTVSESFIADMTPLSQMGCEVSVNEFPQDVSFPNTYKENGTKVKFNVIPKGKRKATLVSYYFLWEKPNENQR